MPDWIAAAARLGAFLLGPLSTGRAACCAATATGGRAAPGYLDDYANVAHGLLELHVATGELRWLEEANRLARLAVELFADDERGGFFLAPIATAIHSSRRRRTSMIIRLPSGNSMLAHVLLRLARIYGDDDLERRAVVGAPPRSRRRWSVPRRPSAGRSVRSSST